MGLAEIFDQPVHRRQDDQRVGRQQAGHQGGQFVVVAEFDFREGSRVVFVDDGDDAVLEQRDQRAAGVEVALVMFQVVVRQENLGDAKAGLGEEPFVQGHQARLADGGAGLQLGKFGGPFGEAQNAHARPHRAGADDDDLFALGAHGGDLGGQLADLLQIGLLAAVGQDAGAQFDHDTTGIFQRSAMHAIQRPRMNPTPPSYKFLVRSPSAGVF
jgi:hypothetical protein